MNLASEKAVGKFSEDDSVDPLLEPGFDGLSSVDCSNDTYVAEDSETISLTSLSRSSAPFFTESSESAASFQRC